MLASIVLCCTVFAPPEGRGMHVVGTSFAHGGLGKTVTPLPAKNNKSIGTDDLFELKSSLCEVHNLASST